MSDETSADRVPKMLTLPEVAKALRCNVRSLYDSGWPKRLGAVKIGNKWLVPEVAVVEVLNGQRPARPQTLTLEGTTDSHREDTEQQVVADPRSSRATSSGSVRPLSSSSPAAAATNVVTVPG
jgi:hypothetical protein